MEMSCTLRGMQGRGARHSSGEPLMNALAVRRPAMKYRDQEIRYESEGDEVDAEAIRQQTDGKQYRSKRSAKPSRRRVTKVAHPGHGIGGRRNRRWTW
jgi:hypothetical protein